MFKKIFNFINSTFKKSPVSSSVVEQEVSPVEPTNSSV